MDIIRPRNTFAFKTKPVSQEPFILVVTFNCFYFQTILSHSLGLKFSQLYNAGAEWMEPEDIMLNEGRPRKTNTTSFHSDMVTKELDFIEGNSGEGLF